MLFDRFGITRFHSGGLCIFVLVLLTSIGCGSGRVSVSGKVTVDSQPTSGVNLRFFPLDGTADALPSSATSEQDGSFSATTNAEPGMLMGKYRVAADYPDPDYKPKKQPGLNFADPQPAPDKFNGKYVNSEIVVEITGATTDLKIDLTTGS